VQFPVSLQWCHVRITASVVALYLSSGCSFHRAMGFSLSLQKYKYEFSSTGGLPKFLGNGAVLVFSSVKFFEDFFSLLCFICEL
jgi:hypothetical protein